VQGPHPLAEATQQVRHRGAAHLGPVGVDLQEDGGVEQTGEHLDGVLPGEGGFDLPPVVVVADAQAAPGGPLGQAVQQVGGACQAVAVGEVLARDAGRDDRLGGAELGHGVQDPVGIMLRPHQLDGVRGDDGEPQVVQAAAQAMRVGEHVVRLHGRVARLGQPGQGAVAVLGELCPHGVELDAQRSGHQRPPCVVEDGNARFRLCQ
jgi:hypothetical protein